MAQKNTSEKTHASLNELIDTVTDSILPMMIVIDSLQLPIRSDKASPIIGIAMVGSRKSKIRSDALRRSPTETPDQPMEVKAICSRSP
jgi:hypothetical protein